MGVVGFARTIGRRWIDREAMARYKRELNDFKDLAAKAGSRAPLLAHPRLGDYSAQHPVPESVFEVSAASRIIAAVNPSRVHDIGSNLHYIAVLSSFIPVVSLDVREILLSKPGFESNTGDARKMPFANTALEFITSLCVMEHIGLGRYGDQIDPLGDTAFAKEIMRCLSPGGHLIVSVPVGKEAVCFNAHRVYSRSRLIDLFPGTQLQEELYMGANGFVPYRELPLGQALTGLFHFRNKTP